MSRKLIFLLFVVLTVSILSLSERDYQQQKVIRYVHPNSSSDIPGQYATLLSEIVEEKSNGEIIIEVYPSSQLGGVREMIEGAQLGIVNMGHNSFAALSQFLPEIAVFNFPFIYDDIDHAIAATDPQQSPIIQEFNERLIARSNLRIVGSYFFGIRRLTTSDFPVYRPSDLQGKKIRAIPLPIWIAMVEGMGAIPTPVDFSELPTALATGIVDGQENPVNTIYSAQMYETQNYLMLTDHMIDINMVYMNNDTFESLSEEQKEIFLEAHKEAAMKVRKRSEELQNSLIEELQKLGMEVISQEDGLEVETFQKVVYAQVLTIFPSWQKYVERIRAMSDEYNGVVQ